MKVSIKDFNVNVDMGSNGIEFDVSDGGHIGDLYVTKTGIVWCAGKTTKKRTDELFSGVN